MPLDPSPIPIAPPTYQVGIRREHPQRTPAKGATTAHCLSRLASLCSSFVSGSRYPLWRTATSCLTLVRLALTLFGQRELAIDVEVPGDARRSGVRLASPDADGVVTMQR